MPIFRWMLHTGMSMPSASSASRQAMTCWYTLSMSVPSRSNSMPVRRTGLGLVMRASLPRRTSVSENAPCQILGSEYMVQSMPARSRSNPLALAVLTCLFERPMHPYEMAQTMRSRAKHESVKLNYGSLYGVVEGLEKRGLHPGASRPSARAGAPSARSTRSRTTARSR